MCSCGQKKLTMLERIRNGIMNDMTILFCFYMWCGLTWILCAVLFMPYQKDIAELEGVQRMVIRMIKDPRKVSYEETEKTGIVHLRKQSNKREHDKSA